MRRVLMLLGALVGVIIPGFLFTTLSAAPAGAATKTCAPSTGSVQLCIFNNFVESQPPDTVTLTGVALVSPISGGNPGFLALVQTDTSPHNGSGWCISVLVGVCQAQYFSGSDTEVNLPELGVSLIAAGKGDCDLYLQVAADAPIPIACPVALSLPFEPFPAIP